MGDGQGNFYGTTTAGGASGLGTIFQLSAGGTFTPHSFTSAEGSSCVAALVARGNGDFLGITSAGGTNSTGTIFEVTPAGVVTVLYNFSALTGADVGEINDTGADPNSPLVADGKGNFYGVAPDGGGNASGTIFELSFDPGTGAASVNAIYTFSATYPNSDYDLVNNDGANPAAPLILGLDGNFYGTAEHGGINGAGNIFQITPDGSSLTPLYNFSGTLNDGGNPTTALVQASTTQFYGTTSQTLNPIGIPPEPGAAAPKAGKAAKPAATRPPPRANDVDAQGYGSIFTLSAVPDYGRSASSPVRRGGRERRFRECDGQPHGRHPGRGHGQLYDCRRHGQGVRRL